MVRALGGFRVRVIGQSIGGVRVCVIGQIIGRGGGVRVHVIGQRALRPLPSASFSSFKAMPSVVATPSFKAKPSSGWRGARFVSDLNKNIYISKDANTANRDIYTLSELIRLTLLTKLTPMTLSRLIRLTLLTKLTPMTLSRLIMLTTVILTMLALLTLAQLIQLSYRATN